MAVNLDTMSFRQLLALARTLRGGSFGFDPYRDPRTNRIDSLRGYINEMGMSQVELDAAWELFTTTYSKPARGAGRTQVSNVRANELLGIAEDEGAGSEPEAAPAAPNHASPQAAGSLDAIVAQIARQAAQGAVNEDRVREIATEVAGELIAEMPVRELIVHINDAAPVTLNERTHPAFDKVLKLATAGLNVLLVGPAGCGKTHLGQQIARALARPFGSVSYSAGASESWLLGRLLPTGEGGKFEHHPAQFCDLYTQASVFLHDEIDAADPNMLLVVNSALANGAFTNPITGTTLHRHVDAIQIGAANTFGTGADVLYVGRNQLDAATTDRWYIVPMDYDRAYEIEAAVAIVGSDTATEVCSHVWRLREKVQAARLRRVISTRAIHKACKAIAAGIPQREALADLQHGWTKDECAKLGA